MTYEEALSHAEKELEAYERKVADGKVFYTKYVEFLGMVASSIKKQIAMKPIKIINDLGICGQMPAYLSPCCRLALRWRHDGDGEPLDYHCPRCGQKILWENEE